MFTDEEVRIFREETHGLPIWQSPLCVCRCELRGRKVYVKPCDYDHVVWCYRVGVPAVLHKQDALSNAMPPESYRKVLDAYLLWGKGMPLGFGHPLGSYMHGKCSKEWHVKEWREGIQQGLFRPEEFIGTLGCTESNYQQLLLAE